MQTNSAHTKARIESIDDTRMRAELAQGQVVIVTGFQGATRNTTSPPLGVVVQTPRPWPWPPPFKPTNA
jgi:aspartate kinase